MAKEGKRIYEGTVGSHLVYANHTKTYFIGKNCNFPEYQGLSIFVFSKFLTGLEGKHVRLTLEVLK